MDRGRTRNETPSNRQMAGRIAREAAWAPLTVLVLHSVGGRILGHEPYVDPVMHFSGGVAAAYFFQRAALIGTRLLGALTPLALDLLAFGLTCAVALLWEFGEHYVRSLDTEDSMRDLFLGMLGAIVYLSAARVYRSLFRRS